MKNVVIVVFTVIALTTTAQAAWAQQVSLEHAHALEQQALSNYDRGAYGQAFADFRTLAEQGNKLAQHNLGAMYFFGQGVERDRVQAAAWLTVAAEHGDADSVAFLDSVRGQLQAIQLADYEQAAAAILASYSQRELDRRARSEARRRQSRNAQMQAMFDQGSQRVHITPRDIKSTACGSAREADIAKCFAMKNQRGMGHVYAQRRRVFTVLDNGGLDADTMAQVEVAEGEVYLHPFKIVPDQLDEQGPDEGGPSSQPEDPQE